MAVETPPVAPPATPPQAEVVLPRSQEVQNEPSEKAAQSAKEAKERMAKTQGFWNKLTPEKEGEKPAEAKAEKPSKEKAKPAAAAKLAEEEAEPKDEKPKRRKREPEVDPLEVARETGREMGREIAKATQANVPRGTTAPAEPEVEVELPEEFRDDVAVFEEMSRLEPKKYGNIKKELHKYTKAENDYIASWEKDNPGMTYDGDAAEHNDFYEKARPSYDQKDFKKAERSLLKKELREEVTQDLRSRESEVEQRREKVSKIEPEVQADMFGLIGEVISKLDPENADLGKSVEALKTLGEKNELLADVVIEVHNSTKPALEAAVRLFRGVDRPDPQNNPAHVRVFSVINEAEKRIAGLPVKDRYNDDGQLFATQEDYAKMSASEKARHWYIGERETVALLRGQALSQAKTQYEHETKRFEAYNKRRNSTQPAQQPEEKKHEMPNNHRADNGSPSVSGRGTLPGDGQSAATKPLSGKDSFFSRIIGA